MIAFMSKPFTDADIENIVNMQERIKQLKDDRRLDEYKKQMNLKPELRMDKYKNMRKPKVPIGNKFWIMELIDGEWINVPIEPDDNDIQEVYVDGLGYVPITRLVDIKGG